MDERIFDVSKPHKVDPGATSKPVIVGHHPEIPDPMIRENAPDKPQISEQPEFGPPTDGNPLGLPEVAAPIPESEEPPSLPPLEQTEEKPDMPPLLEPEESAEEKPEPVSSDQPPPTAQMFNKATGQTVEPTHSSWKPDHELPITGHHVHHSGGGFNKTPLIIIGVILGFLGLYALLDSGLVVKVDLPFHIFSQEEEPPTTATNKPAPINQLATSANYTVAGTDVSFIYPLAWGAPSVTRDPGFSKRGGDNETNGTYAYLVNFAGNKDVQIAITSSQYLPAKRDSLYYDFQQWCSGTADGKIYKEVLMFSTANGVDTPTTVACDEGPLGDAVKASDKVIVQAKSKDAGGKSIGDIYTVNLDDSDLPVLRVKDASSANSEEIEKFLATIKG